MTLSNVIEIGGWIGMILILVAFYLTSNEKIKPKSEINQLMNLIGTTLTGINTFYIHAWAIFILQAAWWLVSIKTLWEIYRRK